MQYQWLENPSICSPAGWSAGAVAAGIKRYGPTPRLDVGLLVADRPCNVAGIFTTNKVPGAPVELCRRRVANGLAQALVVNSGCSNVAMGERGRADAQRMTELVAERFGLGAERVLVGSTGVIGRPLPMDRIADAVTRIEVTPGGGPDFSRAIMTTDTVPKVRAVSFRHRDVTYTVSGTAKGSGMAHPNMATVFCFLTMDAKADSNWLDGALRRVGDQTINMVDVDMDTSTSDMMIAFASGAASDAVLNDEAEGAVLLEGAMLQVATALAKDLARDGEGATALLEAEVRGAKTLQDARLAARAIVSSQLVKSMVTGRDPNLGRVLMAIGKSGADVDPDLASVWIGQHQAFANGAPTELELSKVSAAMAGESVRIQVDLGLGNESAVAWGCNLTEQYVRINADYTT